MFGEFGSLTLRFAKEGYAIALIARTLEKLQPIEKEILDLKGKAISVAADTSNETQVSTAFNEIRTQLGHPEVLLNASII